jgi:hypothetical protein
MRNLNKGQCNTAVLRSLFIEQLPDSYKAILAAVNESDLGKLAEIADRIAESNNTSSAVVPYVASVNKQKDAVPPTSIDEKVERLTKQLASMSRELTKLRRSRSSSRSRTPGPSGNKKKTDKKSGLCYVHRKYGAKATSCHKPCTWQDTKPTEN